MKEYKPHPLAELFPLMPVAEMSDLMKSVKARGLQTPITLYEGKILDGRHRYEACQLAGVEPRFTEYDGDDPIRFVLDVNIHRRHLTTSQRAALAAEVAGYKHGSDRKSANLRSPKDQSANLRPTLDEAAKTLGVSPRSVDSAAKIKAASPKLFGDIKDGKITVHAAEKKVDAKTASKAPEAAEVLDMTGWPIPEGLHEVWSHRGEIDALSREVAAIETKMIAFQKDKPKHWIGLNANQAVGLCQQLHMVIGEARLHAVCTTCAGRNHAKCAHCRGKGILSKFLWDSTVPAEIKAMRQKAKR